METEMAAPPPAPSPDRWCVECSDEEEDEGEVEEDTPLSAGPWTPSPREILRLYLALSRGEGLSLSAPSLPRRPLTPEEGPSTEEAMVETPEEQEDDEGKPRTPTEFDFDDEPAPAKSFLAMRRSPGSSCRPQHRAARLDKVLSDMERHRRIDEQMMKTGRDVFQRDPQRDVTPSHTSSPSHTTPNPSPSRSHSVFQRQNY